jgi:hypothetical protein
MRLPLTLAPATAGLPLLAAEKPNVVVILADDFGYECVAANRETFASATLTANPSLHTLRRSRSRGRSLSSPSPCR